MAKPGNPYDSKLGPPAPWVEPLAAAAPLCFTLTSTGRSAGSQRGHGGMLRVCVLRVCVLGSVSETLLQDPRRAGGMAEGGRGRGA
ncbi:hypothetical protein NQZ68_015976 [Dissostichus eleginoides]|nr:hypothetical protein NQZ68_015976 [Dissostichus eleginoides]